MAEYELYHSESGSWGEHDEYWMLVVPTRGRPHVEIQRYWGNPYKGEVKEDEPEIITLRDFLKTHSVGVVHDKLIDLLDRLGIDPRF